MNALTEDSIAIDTNVFMHLFHDSTNLHAKSCNQDSHIDKILDVLQKDEIRLLIDNKKKIASEHTKYLLPILEGSDEVDTKRILLRYWLLDQDPVEVDLDIRDQLFQKIKEVIHEGGEAVDRVYVYVSHRVGKPLITNDELHILFGPNGEGNTAKNNRRTRLNKATKKHRKSGAAILSSLEAFGALGFSDA